MKILVDLFSLHPTQHQINRWALANRQQKGRSPKRAASWSGECYRFREILEA
jgi:hypothetical protein